MAWPTRRTTPSTWPRGTPVTQPDQPAPTCGSMAFGYAGGEAGTSPLPMDYITFEPAFWRTITFEGRTPDGGEVSVVLLRPLAWLEHNAIEIGSALPVDLGGEHKNSIRATAIAPAPATIEPGSATRGMVISTFRRTDREVFELFLDTDPTPLTITPEHPVWSVDRDGWVAAGDLYQ